MAECCILRALQRSIPKQRCIGGALQHGVPAHTSMRTPTAAIPAGSSCTAGATAGSSCTAWGLSSTPSPCTCLSIHRCRNSWREFYYPGLEAGVHYESLPEGEENELRTVIFPRMKKAVHRCGGVDDCAEVLAETWLPGGGAWIALSEYLSQHRRGTRPVKVARLQGGTRLVKVAGKVAGRERLQGMEGGRAGKVSRWEGSQSRGIDAQGAQPGVACILLSTPCRPRLVPTPSLPHFVLHTVFSVLCF
eukprot:364639-Chlamydomonas_euryale.AAC.36